ncbi:MAG: penicillin-binding transpeptidase domain-containing protein [Pyrinomonadaceae bacterium]
MFSKSSFVRVFLPLAVIGLFFSTNNLAQSKKRASKKVIAKKTDAKAKDAKKDRKEKLTAKSRDAKSKKDAKSKAESKKALAERRRIEAERRAAIAAERRRREQARREAIARKLAFERGLRTETVENISKDVTDGEDPNIRAAAVKALGSRAGSVVVMEAQTGKVLTIVNQDWAVRSGVKPCSTIKLVTGIAALNENVIDKQDGSLNGSSGRGLDDSMAYSGNGYFQRAGVKVGNAKMIEYARQLGLGEPTGLNTEGEYAGKLPHGNNNPRIYSHGDDFEVTGVQLAVMVSAITNGGKRVLPRVPRNNVEQVKFQPFYRADVQLPPKSVRRVIPGMMGAAEYGTARRNMDQNLGVAGKTGSCISKGTWVGLFASVAPVEKPKYSVVVITRGARERGKYAAAVAADIYRALGSQIVRTDRNLAQTEFNLRPRTGLDMTTAAKTGGDEEEDDDADTAETASSDVGDINNTMLNRGNGNVIVVPSAPRAVEKKLVTKTGDSKALFPPVVITYDRSGVEKKAKKGKKQ